MPRAVALAAAAALTASAYHAVTLGASAESQYLPESHIVLKSARNVDDRAGTAVITIHRGVANGRTVWYLITDVSDYGIAHDLDALYAPKLANMAIGCPQCVQTATLGKPTGKFNNEAIVHFQGAPNFGRLSARCCSSRRRRRRALQSLRAHCRLERYLQHAHHRDRRRAVRRGPSYQHGRPRYRNRHETRRRRSRGHISLGSRL
jgi:hypothetical protein